MLQQVHRVEKRAVVVAEVVAHGEEERDAVHHAVVGEGAIVAAGSVVLSKTVIPPNTIWAGVPAKYVKDVDPEQAKEINQRIARDYHMYASWYK